MFLKTKFFIRLQGRALTHVILTSIWRKYFWYPGAIQLIWQPIYSGDLNNGQVQHSQGWFSHVFEMLMVMVQDLSLLRKLGVVCYYKIGVEVVWVTDKKEPFKYWTIEGHSNTRQRQPDFQMVVKGNGMSIWRTFFIVLFVHYKFWNGLNCRLMSIQKLDIKKSRFLDCYCKMNSSYRGSFWSGLSEEWFKKLANGNGNEGSGRDFDRSDHDIATFIGSYHCHLPKMVIPFGLKN